MTSKAKKALAKAAPTSTRPLPLPAKTANAPKKRVTREQVYKDLFLAPDVFIGPDEFMPQVNGYGTPIYAAVGTFAGV